MWKKTGRASLVIASAAAVLFGISTAAFGEASVAGIERAEEFFDGEDGEVRFVDANGMSFETDNEADDRAARAAGGIGTWQAMGPNGWEIRVWTAERGETFLTDNAYDDTEPSTDGRYVAWQSLREDRWVIYVHDSERPDRQPELVSDSFAASRHPVVGGGRVAWQSWLDDNWEIVSWTAEAGTARLTDNASPDITPSAYGDLVMWEGVDPMEGDRDIFVANAETEETKLITDNETTDDAPEFGADGSATWYEQASEAGQPQAVTSNVAPSIAAIASRPAASVYPDAIPEPTEIAIADAETGAAGASAEEGISGAAESEGADPGAEAALPDGTEPLADAGATDAAAEESAADAESADSAPEPAPEPASEPSSEEPSNLFDVLMAPGLGMAGGRTSAYVAFAGLGFLLTAAIVWLVARYRRWKLIRRLKDEAL
jgi:hypothetical protein